METMQSTAGPTKPDVTITWSNDNKDAVADNNIDAWLSELLEPRLGTGSSAGEFILERNVTTCNLQMVDALRASRKEGNINALTLRTIIPGMEYMGVLNFEVDQDGRWVHFPEWLYKEHNKYLRSIL